MATIPLDELVRDLPVALEGTPRVPVTGLAHDSRRVRQGDLFVAIVGERFDGREFAAEAVSRGAVAVLGPPPAPAGLGVPYVAGESPRQLLAPLAARVHRHPDRELVTVGVTGTNGKTTVVHLVHSILEAAGRPCGLIGSLGYRFGDWSEEPARTTPEASDLFRLLRRMRDDGAAAVAMEVSSHALAQGRVAQMHFTVGVFTNLTRDHLDYHRDMEDYYGAKKRLFAQLTPAGRAVVNLDDEAGRRLAGELAGELGEERVVSFGEGAGVAPEGVELTETSTRLTVATPRCTLDVTSRLLGRYNVSNLLAAVAVGEALEIPAAEVTAALERVAPIPGRMEPVRCGQDFPVYIDYSHTPAALEAALVALREFSERKILVVFGCGGDRDPGKRPQMGEIAGRLADLPIVTSDNPRSEDPLAIIAAVEEGLKASGNSRYRVVPDRREAIRRAIAVAGSEWAVLVAGKGSEPVQIIGDETVRFYDREEVEKALGERLG